MRALSLLGLGILTLTACGGATSSPVGASQGDAGGSSSADGGAAPGEDGGAAPSTTPTLLAALGDQPVALSVQGGQVFVALFLQGIVSLPASGGAVTPLVASISDYFQNAFAIQGDRFFFSESSGGYTTGPIASAPIAGGAGTQLTTSMGFTAGIATDASYVYWVDQDQGTVSRLPLAGGSPSLLASGLSSPGGLALDGRTLYLTDAAGDLLSVPTDGGSATTLYTGPGLPPNTEVADWSPSIVTDATSVYFSVCTGHGPQSILRVPLQGGTPTVLASTCSQALAVDARNVYFETTDAVESVPIAGGAPETLASDQNLLSGGLALDDAYVYWATTQQMGTCEMCPPPPPSQNAVYRVAK